MPFQVDGTDMNDLSIDGILDTTISPFLVGLPPTNSTVAPATKMLTTDLKYSSSLIDISNRVQAAYFFTRTPASGSIPNWCNRISVFGMAGGGGGGGAVGNFSPYNSARGAVGGYGGSVASADNIVIAGGSPFSMSIGGGGAGGSGHPGNPANGSGADGSPGGNTTITIGGVSYNASGGGGGGGTNDHTGPLGFRDANTKAAGADSSPFNAPASFPGSAADYGNRGTGGNVNSGGNGNAGNDGNAGVGFIWYKRQS
jgi:hypothetical protein